MERGGVNVFPRRSTRSLRVWGAKCELNKGQRSRHGRVTSQFTPSRRRTYVVVRLCLFTELARRWGVVWVSKGKLYAPSKQVHAVNSPAAPSY